MAPSFFNRRASSGRPPRRNRHGRPATGGNRVPRRAHAAPPETRTPAPASTESWRSTLSFGVVWMGERLYYRTFLVGSAGVVGGADAGVEGGGGAACAGLGGVTVEGAERPSGSRSRRNRRTSSIHLTTPPRWCALPAPAAGVVAGGSLRASARSSLWRSPRARYTCHQAGASLPRTRAEHPAESVSRCPILSRSTIWISRAGLPLSRGLPRLRYERPDWPEVMAHLSGSQPGSMPRALRRARPAELGSPPRAR